MKNNRRVFVFTGITVLLFSSIFSIVTAQDSSPVCIAFDMNSPRVDIMTGKHLPDYTLAQRGSFIFYEGRLDKPVERINYMFAAMVGSDIDTIILIRKILDQHIWALVTRRGNSIDGLNPLMTADVVKTYVISFIPLNPVTHKPESRVNVLLDDLYFIQWEEVDHWLATMSQAEYESAKGRRY